MSLIEELFNIIAPHECLACKTEGALLCERCTALLARVPERCYRCNRRSDGFRTCQRCRTASPLYRVYAFTDYEGPAKELLHAFKFSRARAGAVPVAKALAQTCVGLGEAGNDNIVITHVPTAQSRIRQRGYDQSALAAKALAARLGLPYVPLLGRIGSSRQLGQHRKDRIQQMSQAFRPLRTYAFQNKYVLLVDDVLTTGASCEAAARVLRQAGAKRVSAAVFAVA